MTTLLNSQEKAAQEIELNESLWKLPPSRKKAKKIINVAKSFQNMEKCSAVSILLRWELFMDDVWFFFVVKDVWEPIELFVIKF